MLVNISTKLNCTPEQAWKEVQTSRLLHYVTSPLLTFKPIVPAKLPELWTEGTYQVGLWIFGLIPFGKHSIVITVEDADPRGQIYQIRDNGYGDLISTWDHRITIQAGEDGKTLYSDSAEIKAGVLTFLIWLYEQLFYRYRQSRWRKLAKNHFVY